MKLYLAPLLFTFASAAVPALTPENWDELTAGKTAFIKFFAPWCGHCKSMAADWEKLADEWADSEVGIIAEVDCTIETNTPICGGVQGYPTVKYGDPNALEDYAGAREYEELAKFAQENLKPMCSPVSLDNCTEEEKTEIAKFDKLSVEELTAAVAEVDEAIQGFDAEFEAEVDKLQTKYDQLSSDVETKTENLKNEKGLKFLKTVLASKSNVVEGSDEL
jgi:protein disulfide-isomerase-like protein